MRVRAQSEMKKVTTNRYMLPGSGIDDVGGGVTVVVVVGGMTGGRGVFADGGADGRNVPGITGTIG